MSLNPDALMKEALEVSMELINRDTIAPELIAAEAFPYIRRAASKLALQGDLDYTPEEKIDVIEEFQVAMRFYSKVTNTQGITLIDLT